MELKPTYVFVMNGEAYGPGRAKWEDAVADAVRAKQCKLIGPRVIETTPPARIARMRVRPGFPWRNPTFSQGVLTNVDG